MAIKDWPGGTITDIPVEPSGNYEDSAASGVWTVDQVSNYVKQNLWPTPGNIGPDKYVEGVFSTYLYPGTGATQTIINGIDVSGEGGLVWTKGRLGGNNYLFDTERGALEGLVSNGTAASATKPNTLTAFTSSGFTLGPDTSYGVNVNNDSMVSWTFRKKAKFFDVVTYTGTTANQVISHGLGSIPGMIIVRALNGDNWFVWHNSLSTSGVGAATGHYRLHLNATTAKTADNGVNTVTDSSFTVFGNNGETNSNSAPYVAYVFANDSGGFGDDGSESIIKCGSYTGNGSADGPTINCGFEPQWLLIKNTSDGGNWVLMDAMRGMPVGDEATVLLPNASGAESSYANLWGVDLQATGFKVNVSQIQINESGGTMVYIAIRRPMKTPESGTEVFDTILRTGTGSNATITGMGFTPDLAITKNRASDYPQWAARLTNNKYLKSSTTDAETTNDLQLNAWDVQEGLNVYSGGFNSNGDSFANWFFKRATGFFDVVAYKGSSSVYLKDHNLGVVPEMMIVKNRNAAETGWSVYHSALGADYRVQLNSTSASSATSDWDNASDVGTAPTATQFNVKTSSVIVNNASYNYIAYLFATLAGVSKVGSYTGTGSDQNIDCGFSAGARFVLIKRTSGTGNWYVYDSARGIVAGNDPYLLLNSTAAEVTSTDYIDPFSSGFAVTTAGDNSTNINGSNYIFLAIA